MRTPTITRPIRRAAATMAVLLLGILPTTLIGWTAWRLRRPAHREAVAASLARTLGGPVEIEGVRYPRPGTALYRGLSLGAAPSGPGSGRGSLKAGDVRVSQVAGATLLEVDRLEIAAGGPREILESAIAWIGGLRGDAPSGRFSIVVESCDLTMDAGDRPLRLRITELAGTSIETAGSSRFSASYRLPRDDRDDAPSRCELTLDRSTASGGARTILTFATRDDRPVSARVLAPLLDVESWLGPESKILGTMVFRQAVGSDWEADFQGTIEGVDLGTLVSGHFPEHHLSGRARLDVRSARWGNRGDGQGTGWVSFEGDLTAGPGTIGRGLLDALGRQLAFRVPPSIAPIGPDLPFQALGLSFAMSREGQLTFRGGLGPERPRDAVLIDGARPTPLANAPKASGDVRGLIQALFPAAMESPATLIPGTPEAQGIQRYLPTPPALAVHPPSPAG